MNSIAFVLSPLKMGAALVVYSFNAIISISMLWLGGYGILSNVHVWHASALFIIGAALSAFFVQRLSLLSNALIVGNARPLLLLDGDGLRDNQSAGAFLLWENIERVELAHAGGFWSGYLFLYLNCPHKPHWTQMMLRPLSLFRKQKPDHIIDLTALRDAPCAYRKVGAKSWQA